MTPRLAVEYTVGRQSKRMEGNTDLSLCLSVHGLSLWELLYWSSLELVRLLMIFITFTGSASVSKWEISACAKVSLKHQQVLFFVVGRRPKAAKATSLLAHPLTLCSCPRPGLCLLTCCLLSPVQQPLPFPPALGSGPAQSALFYCEMPRAILLIVSTLKHSRRKFKYYCWLLWLLTLTAFSWEFPHCSVKPLRCFWLIYVGLKSLQ